MVVPDQEKRKMGWQIETASFVCAARLANQKHQLGVFLFKYSITVVKRGIAAWSSSFGIQYAIDLQSLHTVACVDYIQK
jgi:hypothetical protein